MPAFLESAWAWFQGVHGVLYLVTALIAIVWAASEVIVGSPERPAQALWTWGAWLLFLLNALFACLVLAASMPLTESTSIWLALGVGLSWQAMLRGGINIQPLPISSVPGEQAEKGLGVPLNELYSRLQTFCVGQIQRQLMGRRIDVIERSIQALEAAELAHLARLVSAALGDATADAEQYIRRLETDTELSPERKEILLITLVLDKGGEGTLRKAIRRYRRQRRT